MLTRVAQMVCETPPAEIGRLALEEVALSLAWFDSLEENPGTREPFAAIPRLADQWTEEVQLPSLSTEGRRQQPLLRRLLGDLQTLGASSLRRSALDFLVAVKELTECVSDPTLFERISGLLEPRMQGVLNCMDRLPPQPGLPGIKHYISYVTAAVLEAGRIRSIRTFSGIDMPGRGPLHTLSGNVKVLGHVPEDCMLVAEGGACTVSGYVMGRVAAKWGCEVRENIAGVIVVNEGEIRARKIINNAFVVSKLGSVCVRGAENPALLYAGTEIRIHGDAITGRYASPRIAVDGEALGGDFSVSELLTAERFCQSATRGLNLMLQRRITCESYGEYIGNDATRLLARIAKLRRKRANVRTMVGLVGGECEDFASSGIMFLFGGDKLTAHVKDISNQQRRLAFLDRVIAGIEALSMTAEEQLQRLLNAQGDLAESDAQSAFQDLDREISSVESEGSMDSDLDQERTELREVTRDMDSATRKGTMDPVVLYRLRSKKVSWLLERDSLTRSIGAKEREMKRILGHVEALEEEDSNANRVQVFKRVLAAARGNTFGDRIVKRASSRFIAIMLRAVDKRIERMRRFSEALEEIERDLEAETKRLEDDHSVMAPCDLDENTVAPRARGRFQGGVTICTDPFLVEESDVPSGSRIVTANTADQIVCYVRQNEGIVEEDS